MPCALQMHQASLYQHATWTSARQRVQIVPTGGTDRAPVAISGCVADAVASTEPAAAAVLHSGTRRAAVQPQPGVRQGFRTWVTEAHAAATPTHSPVVQPLQKQHSGIVQSAQGMQQSTNPDTEQRPGCTAERSAAQQHKQHKQHTRRQGSNAAAAAGSIFSDAPGPPIRKHKTAAAAHGRTGRSGSCHQSQPPVQLPPCERGDTLKLASAVSRHLAQGQAVALPAGTGMQLPRGLAALASARILLLSISSFTGLVFQPGYLSKSMAAYSETNATLVGDKAAATTAVAEEALTRDSKASSGSKNSSSSGSLLITVCRLAEVQLRRHEQSPLIAARYGSPSQLAAAAVARVCQQGLTAVRASGPDAVRVAVHAITQARQKLLAHGLDIAVAPLTEFVDVDGLPVQQEQQPYVEYGSDDSVDAGPESDDNNSRQFVRVTVLHVVRCRLKQPWKLLPQPVPVAQQPAAIWQQRRQRKQSQQQPNDLVQPTVQQREHAVPLLQPQEFAKMRAEQLGHQQAQQGQAEQQPYRQQELRMNLKLPEHCHQSQYSSQQPVLAAQQQQAVSEDVRLFQGAVVKTSPTNTQPSILAPTVALPEANETVPVLQHMQRAGRPPQPHKGVEASSHCSSVTSIDGSIWCQPEDVRFTAVYVGEGDACADVAGDDDILQGSTASSSSTKHPGQPMLLHKQRRETSSKRQLVAAAQGQGQVPASSGH